MASVRDRGSTKPPESSSAPVGEREFCSADDGRFIRCVIYAAKSTEDKRGSIPDQLRECRELIEHDADRELVGEYEDEAFSAFSGSRGPGLVGAMQHVEALAREHGAAELWAQHSDRLARGDGKSARHAVEIALWALKRDVRVRTIQDPDTFRDLLYAVVTGQRNHEDSRRKGLAVSAGRRRAAARGSFLGCKPDGYRVRVELDESGEVKKHLVIDPERQPVFETLFRLALRGRSTVVIAKALNDAGWLTKPFFRDTEPLRWTRQRVRDVLKNPRYAGLAVVKGEVVASGHWPAYITPRQHARLKARKCAPMKAPRPLETYLLTRLATCGRCGAPLVARTQEQRTDGTFDRRYACAGHKQDRHAARCRAPLMSADLIEAMFIASLWSLLLDGDQDRRAPEAHGCTAPTVSAVERQSVIDAVLVGDHELINATLANLIEHRAPEATLLRRIAISRGRQGPQLDAVRKFEVWAEQEQIGRTEATRGEARALNGVLRTWFSRIVVTMDETSVTIAAVPRLETEQPTPKGVAEVHFDVQDWTRFSTQARWFRRRYRGWSDAEILGALQAWADTHGRSPTPNDWAAAELDHPLAGTVLSHFKSWRRALRQAELEPHAADQSSRNWAWDDIDIVRALTDWNAQHGRPPAAAEWLRAAPQRPSSQTVREHFGTWRAGLAAAGLDHIDGRRRPDFSNGRS